MFGANTVMPVAAIVWCWAANPGRSWASGPPSSECIAGASGPAFAAR